MKKTISILAIIMLLVFTLSMFVGCDMFRDNGDDNNDTGKDGYYAIDVYGINDLHGKFEDTTGENAQPGVDEMTTYLKTQALSQNTIFLSSGDMWQGSCESGLTKGNIITDWMNDLGFASMTLGNHEFDWGIEPIKDNIAKADFPVLAINVFEKATNQRLEGCQASVVVDKGDVQIGIIGAIGDCYSSIATDKTKDVYFKVDDELTALVEAESTRLRAEEGVDFVILSLHDGAEQSSSSEKMITSDKLDNYYDPSLSSGSVDLVFEGHTHKSYIFKDTYGVYHLQGGGDNGKGIMHAQILFNLNDGTARVRETNFVTHSIYSNLNGDAIVDTLIAKYDSVLSTMDNKIGTNRRSRDGEALQKRVAQLYYEAGMEKWGQLSTYKDKVILGGGSLNVRSPYNLYTGDITYAMLYMLFPFDNEIVLCSIKGKDLKSRFIQNGEYVCYYGKNKTSNDVIDSISDNLTYYIITDTWNSGYTSNRLTVIDYLGEGIYARDLLAEHAAAGGFAS